MASQNVVEAVAELGSECYREREELRAEIARLRAELRKYAPRQMPACGSGSISSCGCSRYSIEGGGSVVFKCLAHQTPCSPSPY